jgi:hypothetical protein
MLGTKKNKKHETLFIVPLLEEIEKLRMKPIPARN